MTVDRQTDYLISLIHELRKLPTESEWVEFKHNHADHKEIGEYISALANSAALLGKSTAYLVWGIDDKSHEVKGTRFAPSSSKIGNEELENWLLRLLDPKINFRFFSFVAVGHIYFCAISPRNAPGSHFVHRRLYFKKNWTHVCLCGIILAHCQRF